MYINFKNLKKSKLTPEMFFFLIAIKQKETLYIEENIHLLEEVEEYTALIKGRKNQHIFEKIRLNKKGKSLLDNIEAFGIDKDDEKLFEFIKNIYVKLGKEIGNSKKTKRYINWFKKETGIDKNRLISLLKTFVSDEENMNYNHVLEYAFYKPPTVFETRPKLEESRLYNYYLKHKQQFDKIWGSNKKYE